MSTKLVWTMVSFTQKFLNSKFFRAKIFLRLNLFWTQNCAHKFILDSNFFEDKEKFFTRNFCDLQFFNTEKYSRSKYFREQLFLAKYCQQEFFYNYFSWDQDSTLALPAPIVQSFTHTENFDCSLVFLIFGQIHLYQVENWFENNHPTTIHPQTFNRLLDNERG